MLLILFNFLNIQNKRSQKSGRNFLSLKTNSDRFESFESIVTFIYETKINDIMHKIIRTNFKYWEHTF